MSGNLLQEEGLFFTMFYYLWNFFTWGFIPHIVLFFFSILVIFFLLIIIKDFKIIRYVVKDKYLFIKYFLYDFILEKIYFMKSYYITIKWKISNWDWYVWAITISLILIIGSILIFSLFFVLDLTEQIAVQNSTNFTQ